MFAHGLFEQGIKFLPRLGQCATAFGSARESPVRFDAHLAGAPFEPVSRLELLNTLDQRPRTPARS